MSHYTLRRHILLWFPGGREGVNTRHVVRNFFLLKLVTLEVTELTDREVKNLHRQDIEFSSMKISQLVQNY
jgi:hypothetical protein